jgi:hypothetical protein
MFAPGAPAQQPRTELDQFREQVKALEQVQCDLATSLEVRRLNKQFLERRLAALASLLRSEIAALTDYSKRTVGLTATEREEVAARSEQLQSELNAISDVAAPCGSSPQSATPPPMSVTPTKPDHTPQRALPVAMSPAPATAPAAAPDPLPAQTESPPAKVRLSPSSLTFKRQPWGTESEPQTVTVTNTTGEPVAFLPPDHRSRDFQIRENSCGTVVQAHETCNFKVMYVPFGPEPAEAAVYVVNDADLTRDKYEKLRLDYRAAIRELEHATEAMKAAEELLAETKQRAEAGVKALIPRRENAVSDKSAEVNNKRAKVDQAWQALVANAPSIQVKGTPEHWKHPFLRAVGGLDLSAVSSRTVRQKYFFEFDLIAPIRLTNLRAKNEDPLESGWWVWTNPRITSLPQATNFSALSTINESGAFFQNLRTQGTVADIAQGLDVSAGLEWALVKPRNGIPWWNEFPNTQARLSFSLIAGVGGSTPFSTDKTDVPSKVNQSICDAFNNAKTNFFTCVTPTGSNSPVIQDPKTGTTKSFITFVTPDRSRFFRRYFAGFRLNTYFFSKDVKDVKGEEAPYSIFPGVIDLTFGQDEAVTGGIMRGVLFRADAAYPIPFYQGIHIYVSYYTRITSNRPSAPFSAFTIQSPDAGSNNDANTFRFAVPPLSRDYFRIGLGVDIIQVFKKLEKGGQPSSKGPTPPAK